MRTGIVAALALLACACGPMADNRSNKIAELSLPADYDPMAPLVVDLALQSGRCRAAVAGEAIDGERLLARALVTLKDSVDVQEAEKGAVDDLPSAVIRAAPDMAWRCVGGAIYQLQRAGFARLLFGSTVNGDTVPFDLPLRAEGIVYEADGEHRIALNADGSFLLSGTSIEPGRLSEALRTYARQTPLPFLLVRPAAQTRLDAVVGLLVRIREAGIDVTASHPDSLELVGFESRWNPDEDDGLERFAGELK